MNLHQILLWKKNFEKKILPPQNEGLNESQQDAQRERPKKQRKEWPCDWCVATNEVECATIVFFKRTLNVVEALRSEDAKK